MSTGAEAVETTTLVASPRPIVIIEGLTKRYGTLKAVDDLNLEIPAGSIFGLIGPNGAGKTTTFQVLATLLRPSSGRAIVCGHDVVEEPFEVRRVVGYMPDTFGLYDEIRVSEYLHFFASAYRIPPGGQDRIVADLLELVDLSSKSGSLVDSLSRGMKQRLGLARALVHDPQVLILDEPASGLDPRARGELRELLLELQRMGKTILISSHILPELEEMCTHIGIIEAGQLLVAGVPSQILEGGVQARPFRMRLVSSDDHQKALELLVAAEEVSAARCESAECEFVLAGGDEVAAGLLARLIAAGVPVAGFGETQADLEDIFLKITKGVVQ